MEKYFREVAERLVVRYKLDPCGTAALCDETLDRSGALLGYVRDAVRAADKEAKVKKTHNPFAGCGLLIACIMPMVSVIVRILQSQCLAPR